jgi:hypothetical protein
MLSVVDDVLARALAPVLRDLRSTGIAEPRIEDTDWADDPGYPSVMLWSPAGNGMGLQVERAAPEAERVGSVADQVQEWAIEELWGRAPTNWPRCPHHPDAHPLRVSTSHAVAVWVCPVDDIPVSQIGGLS